MQVKQRVLNTWSRTRAGFNSHFTMPLLSKLNDASLHHVELAEKHRLLGHSFRAHYHLKKAMLVSPVHGKNGRLPEKLADSSMEVASLLAKEHSYKSAIRLLEKVSESTSEDANGKLAVRIKEIKQSAADYWLADATNLATRRPWTTSYIMYSINMAEKFAPGITKEKFVFLESASSVIVTREAYDAMLKKNRA